ncbi:hypothetical protein FQN54_005561 [Arachnomyces sp. PD_36]|nr:hypothetical protein FQN54_005561 [Arachnomyces sp. PD_36]
MPMGSSEGPGGVAPRTPQSVRIARERDYHLSRARENLRRKEEEARGRKRKWSSGDDSLFFGSDEDSEASAPPVPELRVPAFGAPADPEISPPESQDGPENKRVRREVTCTCYSNKDERCPRAEGLGLEKCPTSFAPARKKSKPKTERTSERTSTKIKLGNTSRGKNPRAFQDLSEFMAQYHKFVAANSEAHRSRFTNNLRTRLESLMFFQFPDKAIESPELKRFLDSSTGIPQLFTNRLLPWEIIADAEVLYERWNPGDLDSNLLRGIDLRQGVAADGKKAGHISRSLTPHHPSRKSCEYVGEGHLRNGQWFPYQICAVRDGAHGDHEAGIYGKFGLGALSVVLSSSGRTGASSRTNTYANVDEGNEISYCGTRSKDDNPTAGTNLLLESERNRNPIRVFRSARLSNGNPYRPEEGLRYDGLYECAGKEVLEQANAMFRFKLIRLPDQKPIRNQGPYKRPTKREILEIKEVKALLKQNNTV